MQLKLIGITVVVVVLVALLGMFVLGTDNNSNLHHICTNNYTSNHHLYFEEMHPSTGNDTCMCDVSLILLSMS